MSDKSERLRDRSAALNTDCGCERDREPECGCGCSENSAREGRRSGFTGPVCIHTDQIYDSCKDRDCIRDARVYFTNSGQEIIDRAINVKIKKAEIIWVYTTVEEVPFNRGYFTVDIKYFIKVTVDAFRGVSCPTEVEGLTTFDKKVILFGSEGGAKVFESDLGSCSDIPSTWQRNNLPKAIVEVVDPIALAAKLINDDCCCCCDCSDRCLPIPENICACFDDELYIGDEGKLVLVTLGLFTIVKIERNVQLLINAIDFCIPDKECPAATEGNPCELFDTIRFPLDEFFPPQRTAENGGRHTHNSCGCCN